MKAVGRGGGEGWDKEEGEGSTPPVFSNTPQFELSGNKPACGSSLLRSVTTASKSDELGCPKKELEAGNFYTGCMAVLTSAHL
jgi:hypothetical protein